MFSTLKSKILAVTVLMLALLMLAFGCYAVIFRMKTKQLMLHNYSFSINSFVQNIDEKIINMENNSKDLTLIGDMFYKTNRDRNLTNASIVKIFKNYEKSLGGGIWFEPYVIDKSKKRTCFYVFKNSDGSYTIDNTFSSKEYDYHNQIWYKQIISKVTKEKNAVWSSPYFENQGSRKMMITVGSGIYNGNKLIGISTVDWDIGSIVNEISSMKPLENGFAFFEKRTHINDSFVLFANTDYDFIIAASDPYLDNNAIIGKSLSVVPWYNNKLRNQTYITYHDKKYVPYVKTTKNGMELIICISKTEMFKDVNKFVLNILILLMLIGISIPSFLYYCLNKYIIKPIDKLTAIAKKIGRGENAEIKIDKPEEFAQLAATFEKMTHNIKEITKEKEKINSELLVAKSIQKSSLPNIFPPFPEIPDFDIYASMDPAKEVGGDFYDFYMLDDNKIMFLIADVSGKGMPAALFMMSVKTLIANLAQISTSPENIIENINKQMYQSNTQGFFVTMLAGICEINSGKLSLINCGHNKPLLKRQNGNYEYLDLPSNSILGIFDDTQFEIYETQLYEGDLLFTYTDGITEAINDNFEMFGEKRLYNTLNNIKQDTAMEKITDEIKADLNKFTQSVPQNDDITMLIFKYNKKRINNEKRFKTIADTNNYKSFCEWLNEIFKEWDLNKALKNKIDMCAEEIFANITFYAYPETRGEIEITAQKNENELKFTFIDSGIAYNPLEKPDPDITLPAEERPVGGLGIYIVKQMTKDIKYERIENKNILTLIF